MGDKIIKTGIRNIIYIIFAQSTSLILSFFTSFVLPIILGLSQFSYWQIYLFYTGYVGIFCIGFNDGIYLKYGGIDYENLPFDKLRTSIWIFIMMQFIYTFIILFIVFNEPDINKRFSLIMASINIIIVGLTGTLSIILQITNKIKLYTISTILNKVIFLIIILISMLIKIRSYKFLIVSDIFCKIIVLFLTMYYCKEIFWGEKSNIKIGFSEFFNNIKVGINLMIANIMGMLVLGLGRIIVEHKLSIEEYGLYSFSISSTNIALMFIGAISLALYPMLKRLESEKIAIYYNKINEILNIFLFAMLLLYFPICIIIKKIMVEYEPILDYLYILFPIIISQGKIQLLLNTYYKTLRKEKQMLKANISSVIFFVILIIPVFNYNKSIKSIVVCTLITMIWRCYASEIYIRKKINIINYRSIVIELVMTLSFIIINYKLNYINAFVIYLIIYIIYLINKRAIIMEYVKDIILK